MFKKKFLSVLLAIATLLSLMTVLFTSGSYASSYNGANWMSGISGNKYLSEISIPGTHETCARYEDFPGTAKCQNLTLSEQLNIGVRYIDIRCRRYDNSFTIHHGVKYQNMNFQDVLNSCYDFLNANPSEVIIMSVKEEYDASGTNDSFEAIFNNYISGNLGKWYLGDSIPQLSAVRGKIVLVRRFNWDRGIPAFHGWSDNTSFTINNSNCSISVQDHYSVSSKAVKWTDVQNFYSTCSPSSNRFYINYSSGYTSFLGIPRITTVSNHVNPKLLTYFNGKTGFYGITAMDFVTANLADAIIATNY